MAGCRLRLPGALLAGGIALGAAAAPEDERTRLEALYRASFPGIPLQEWVNGALIFSADARAQFDSIMEFPPFLSVVEEGRRRWETPFADGGRFADCFADGGRDVAGTYPRYDPLRDRVITFEAALNDCLRGHGEAELPVGDMRSMGVLTAYARSLSDGMPMQIKVDGPGALAKFEAGRDYYYRRRGQLDFACASCHVQNAGRILRTEYLSPAIGQATHWPVFRGGDSLNTIQARYRRCLEQIRAAPEAPGSEDFNNLEYFHSYLSNGLPLRASVFRK